jgi:hypothetical protein
MNATQEEAEALGLKEEELALFCTPFKDMTKEGSQAALALGDRVFNYRLAEKQKLKAAEELLDEETKIHMNKENMAKLKRNFY